MLGEHIVFMARETGWPLEYVGKLHIKKFIAICDELYFLKQLEQYRLDYNFGLLLSAQYSDKHHHYKPKDFAGEPPEKEGGIMENLTTPVQPMKMILGDGKEYELGELNVNIMEALEEEFNQNWDELMGKMRAKILKALVFFLLRGKYPELTRDKVGELLTAKVLLTVYQTLNESIK